MQQATTQQFLQQFITNTAVAHAQQQMLQAVNNTQLRAIVLASITHNDLQTCALLLMHCTQRLHSSAINALTLTLQLDDALAQLVAHTKQQLAQQQTSNATH